MVTFVVTLIFPQQLLLSLLLLESVVTSITWGEFDWVVLGLQQEGGMWVSQQVCWPKALWQNVCQPIRFLIATKEEAHGVLHHTNRLLI